LSLPDNRLVAPLAAVLDAAPPSWRPLVERWRASPAGQALAHHVAARQAAGATIYPAAPLRALELTPRHRVRVVILGQDPYHGPGQAEGLAFSVPRGVPVPPSLRNIFKELARDLGLPPPAHGHLGAWARQGVLLLNTALTVEAGGPASHARRGWEVLTDLVVTAVAEDEQPKVFMLWGGHAQARAPTLAADTRHVILASNHPSPLSASRPPAPFIGNGHFGAANRYLIAHRGAPIDWGLQ
jgi:uracil-DNA glycosylase